MNIDMRNMTSAVVYGDQDVELEINTEKNI